MDVVYAALLTFTCFLLVFAVWSALAVRWIRREKTALKQEVADALRSFVTSPDKDTPSALAVLTDQVALLLAARLVQQVRASLAGMESGASKQEAAETEAAVLSGGPPWLTILSQIIPQKLKRQLLRNPQMVGALASLVGKNGEAAPGPGAGSGSQGAFPL